ncbi:MAG: transposase [Eubacteriales bacterium]|nr:transposase [Eubacteriales bacterium]
MAKYADASSGTKFAKAVQYALNEKKYLYHFLKDSRVPIDNNRAENAIRPFVVGRKNWLFSDSVKGDEASVMFYSLAASAIANGMNAQDYLQNSFPRRKRLCHGFDYTFGCFFFLGTGGYFAYTKG